MTSFLDYLTKIFVDHIICGPVSHLLSRRNKSGRPDESVDDGVWGCKVFGQKNSMRLPQALEATTKTRAPYCEMYSLSKQKRRASDVAVYFV